jgi:hypothetical protein
LRLNLWIGRFETAEEWKTTQDELLTRYKDIIMNKYKLNEHLNIINSLKSDEQVKENFDKLKTIVLNS